jgi:CRP-like cAMP-binding protein
MDTAEALGPTWIGKLVEVLQPVSIHADRLAAMDLFAGLARADLKLAAGILAETLVDRGTRMTVQGQPGARLWLILEGQALVSMDARPIRVATNGDLVGLGSMLKTTISPETTIAPSPIRAFEAGAHQFRQLMAIRPVRARLMGAASPRRRSSPAG